MKKVKLSVMLLMLMIMLFNGCGSSTTTVEENTTVLSTVILSTTTETVSIGSSYSLPGTATAVYSDGTTKTVTVTWDKTVSTATAGTTTYTATYTENGVTKSATFKLIVDGTSTTGYKLTIEDVTTTVGGTVAVTVKATGFTTNISGIDIRVKTESSYLEFTSGEFIGNIAGGLAIIKPDTTDSSIIMGATVAPTSSGSVLSGDFFTFNFKALKAGTTKITFTMVDVLNVDSTKFTGIDISDTATITIK